MSCFSHRGSLGKSKDMKSNESSDMRHLLTDNGLTRPDFGVVRMRLQERERGGECLGEQSQVSE